MVRPVHFQLHQHMSVSRWPLDSLCDLPAARKAQARDSLRGNLLVRSVKSSQVSISGVVATPDADKHVTSHSGMALLIKFLMCTSTAILPAAAAEAEASQSSPHPSATRDSMYAEFAAAAAAAAAAVPPPAPIQATAALPFQPLHSMAQHSMAQHSMPLGAALPLSQAPFSALLNPPAGPPSAQQLMQFHQAWTLWQTLLAQSQQPQGQSAGQGPSHQPSLGQLPHLPQLQQPMLLPPMQYQLPAQGRTGLVQQCNNATAQCSLRSSKRVGSIKVATHLG